MEREGVEREGGEERGERESGGGERGVERERGWRERGVEWERVERDRIERGEGVIIMSTNLFKVLQTFKSIGTAEKRQLQLSRQMERTSPEIGMYIEDYNTTGNVLGEINFLTKASRHRTVRCETPVKVR